MVKTPNVRHSKARKDPVTIDLEASRVTPEDAETATAEQPDAATAETAESPLLAEASEAAVEEAKASEIGTAAADAPAATDEHLAAEGVSREAESPDTGRADAESSTEERAARLEEDRAAIFGRREPQNADDSIKTRAASATPPPSPRRGGISAIAAGIIGGVITLIGAGALQYGGVLPSPGDGGTGGAAVEDLNARITSLQTELAALKEGGDASGTAQTVADLQARIDTLTATVDTMQKAVQSGGAGENAGLAALDSKIAELQAEVSRLGQAGAGQPVDLAPLNNRIAALETGMKSLVTASTAGQGRLTKLEQAVTALAGKVDAQANQPKIALSIAASALKAAVDRGQSFSAELDTLAAISPNLPQLAALRAHAEAGVSARDDLDAEMEGAAKTIIAADKPADPNASYVDQLWESAASLVTVRPVGAVAGAGVPETVARMEAALKAGDLAKALAEYDTLPEPAKAAGAAFAGKIKARLNVETLVDQAIAEAMKTV
jgi:hypothetical protein